MLHSFHTFNDPLRVFTIFFHSSLLIRESTLKFIPSHCCQSDPFEGHIVTCNSSAQDLSPNPSGSFNGSPLSPVNYPNFFCVDFFLIQNFYTIYSGHNYPSSYSSHFPTQPTLCSFSSL